MRGYLGCNPFHGEIRLLEQSTEFGALAATRMYCAACSEQENKIQNGLHSARGYSFEKDSLKLQDANGETLLSFRAFLVQNTPPDSKTDNEDLEKQ